MEEGSIHEAPSCESLSSDDHHETLSLFGASNSGEPLVAQLLVMDFTPTEMDTAYVKTKVIAFWDYIQNRKDLHSLRVKPDISKVVEDFSADPDVEPLVGVDEDSLPELTRKQSTAVSMLEFVEEKGLINRIFEAKLQQSHCSLGPREYHEEDPVNKLAQKQDGICSISQTSYVSKSHDSTKKMRPHLQRRESHQAYNLCRTLQDWDADHPKSMTQPGHPPSLCYRPAVQRKIDM